MVTKSGDIELGSTHQYKEVDILLGLSGVGLLARVKREFGSVADVQGTGGQGANRPDGVQSRLGCVRFALVSG